jgi:hypothetical protein
VSYRWRSVALKLGRFAVGWWTRVPAHAEFLHYTRDSWSGLNLRLWRFGLTILTARAYRRWQEGRP